jgi:hypothetical protein
MKSGTACADRPTSLQDDWVLLFFAVAVVLGFVCRVTAGWGLPLWFDETFTGTIAAQKGFADLVRWCLSELTGPAFYFPMWLWVKVAGSSDVALRAPALAFSFITPLIIAFWGHPDRTIRLFWATLILLWEPVLAVATEARPYPQLLFLCTLQSIVFMRVQRSPSRRNATAWAIVASLALLTHYYAILVVGLQGLAIVVCQRHAWKHLLPAVLPFCVAAIWIAFHLNFLMGFAETRATSYAPMPLAALLLFPICLLGAGLHGFAIFALLIGTAPRWWKSARSLSPEAQMVWIGAIATVILFISGTYRATVMPRYFTPAIPAILLGIAYWAYALRNKGKYMVLTMFALFFFAMVRSLVLGSYDLRFDERRYFQIETASDWLLERNPERLHFLWSTPTGAFSNPKNLADVAGFFFARSGHPVQVIVAKGSKDYNRLLGEAAGNHPSAAILWVSDNTLPATERPALEGKFPGWTCRDFGGEGALIYACRH